MTADPHEALTQKVGEALARPAPGGWAEYVQSVVDAVVAAGWSPPSATGTGAGWRAIEEAPRDGTWVLATHPEWLVDAPEVPIIALRWSGALWIDENHMESEPTHFMPLPAPPVPEPSDV